MKKIVPFKKDIIFKSNLSEITSISLEHSLHYEENNLVTGELVISGEYKMTDTSINTETFSFNLPFDINLDDKYILDKAVIDIDDFYYEIVNNNVLSVNIDVLIDKLEEAPLMEEFKEVIENKEEINLIRDEIDKVDEENPYLEEFSRNDDIGDFIDDGVLELPVKSLFDSITDEEDYATYKICIVREGDNLENIMVKYSISREELSLYNDLREIKIGDKLIIPSINAAS